MGKNIGKTVASGLRDGFPIGLGYFAVAFSLGITAHNVGMTAFQGAIMSLLTVASAGEYAGIAAIREGATYLELALLILVTNARYLLMSCALSQKISPKTGLLNRLFIGYGITDEIFGISIAQPAPLNPIYVYSAFLTSIPLWSIGTALGIIAGNILPVNVVYALSASIYGMFLAVVIPPCRKDKAVFGVVVVSFLISTILHFIPLMDNISESFRIIILTIVISVFAAIVFPHKDEEVAE